jgi:hypothetical protein
MSKVLEAPDKLTKLLAHAMYANVNPRSLDEVRFLMDNRRNHSEGTRRGPRIMSITFTPRFREGQMGVDTRKRLRESIENQLITKKMQGNSRSLRVGEAARFTADMSKTKYSTFTKSTAKLLRTKSIGRAQRASDEGRVTMMGVR